jgi:TusA-related sulfurtransferase
MSEFVIEKTIDLRGTPCPLNWVKTKLRLEEMAQGALLEVLVDNGAPARNVPRSAEGEGHVIVQVVVNQDCTHILIEKKDIDG